MSHTASSGLKKDLRQIYDLYSSYYSLFGKTSPEVQKVFKEKFLKEKNTPLAKDEAHETQEDAARKKLKTSQLFKKIANQFIYHTDLGMYGLTIGAKNSYSAGAMKSYQSQDCSESMATLNCVVASVSLAINYQKVLEQNKILVENGLITLAEITERGTFKEAFDRSKTGLALSVIGAVATAISVLPDPTFATKIISAILFVGMNLYGSVNEFKSGLKTSPMIKIIQTLKYDAHQNPQARFNYSNFVEEILRKNANSADNAELKELMNVLLVVGEQLKKTNLDLDSTELTQKEWLEMAEETLKFKRKLHFFNAFRSFISGMVSGLAMSIGAALLLKNIQYLMNQISLPYVIASIILTSTRLLQNFTVHAFFRKKVLKNLSFAEKLNFSEPVLSKNQIKILESKPMQLKLKQYRDNYGIDLFKTLKTIKTLKTGDSMVKNSAELKKLLGELNQADKTSDALRIDLLVQIGREIQTIFPLAKAVKSNSPQALTASAFFGAKRETTVEAEMLLKKAS